MRQLCAIVCLTFCAAAVTSRAPADNVTLTNGVEIHNAQIINETDHVVTLQIVGLTRVVLGKGEIDRIERTTARQPTRQVPGRPAATAPPHRVPAPAPDAPGIIQILKVAARQHGVTLEFRLDISAETGLRCAVYPSDQLVAGGSRTYTITATDGSPISVTVTSDYQGNVTGTEIVPPVPPIDASEDEYEYMIETIGGGTFRIRAIWDVLNSEIIDINILLL